MNNSRTDEPLPLARQRLNDAVCALIDPQRHMLDTGRFTYLDSVYQQLADACYEKHSLGGGRAQPAAPLFIDAVDTLRSINDAARVEHPAQPDCDAHSGSEGRLRPITVWRLQQIDARTWRPQDTEHINQFASDLERLTHKAVTLLENQLGGNPQIPLPNPCPLCGLDEIYVDDSGDQVRRHPLRLTIDYCRCDNPECRGFWPNTEFAFLGRLLGYRPPEGLIGA